MNPMIPASILFALTYVLMISFAKYRPYIALISGVLFILTGMLPANQIIGALDFNVLLMIGGTMGLVQLFIDSRMPERLADTIMDKVPNVQWAAVSLSLFAGIAVEMGIDSTALYFGLLSGATLGGNCTPIGASANITGIGILRKEGHEVSNGDFFKIGIPFTLAAIVPAYILIWILFGV